MLAPASRLRSRAEFAEAVQDGRRAGTRLLVVHLCPVRAGHDTSVRAGHDTSVRAGHDSTPTRAGFVVSRAVGTAVVRNRLRRRLRHLVRGRLDQLPAGSMLVVRANPAAGAATFADLGRHLDRALARVTEVPTAAPRT